MSAQSGHLYIVNYVFLLVNLVYTGSVSKYYAVKDIPYSYSVKVSELLIHLEHAPFAVIGGKEYKPVTVCLLRIDLLSCRKLYLDIKLSGNIGILIEHMLGIDHAGLEILLCVLTALSITPFCYVALFSEKKWVTLEDLKRGFRYNYKPETKEAFIGSMIQILLAEGGESVKVHVEHKLSQQMEAQEESESPVPWPKALLFSRQMPESGSSMSSIIATSQKLSWQFWN